MNKSITRTWLLVNLVMFIYLIYLAFTEGFEHTTTKWLMVVCSVSSTVYLAYKIGLFKKGALRPDAETENK